MDLEGLMMVMGFTPHLRKSVVFSMNLTIRTISMLIQKLQHLLFHVAVFNG